MQTPNWQEIRQNHPALQNQIYFDSARCGILSKQTAKVGHQFYQDFVEKGSAMRPIWEAEIKVVRQKAANTIGAKPNEITLVPNCSIGLNYAAQMLRTRKEGQKVLLLSEDYASVKLPWLVNRFEVVDFPQLPNGSLEMESLKETILKQQIEVVAVSYVQFSSGYKIDLEALGVFCRKNGVVLVIDATQAFGAMPMDVKTLKVDILVASVFKWACAGFGVGIMYVREELFEAYRPPVMGAESQGIAAKIEHISDINFSGYTFQTGNYDYKSNLILGTAIDQMNEIGLENIEYRIEALQNHLLLQLQKIGVVVVSDYSPSNRAAITIIEGSQVLWEFLKENNTVVSLRGKGIRISPHYYNTFEDIDNLCALLQQFAKSS
ncbi:MAG: aminotransferase class V-fold PLP-dependent enzyme [Chitinophagales bacterium]